MSIVKPIQITDETVTLSRADFDALVEAAEDRIDLAASAAFDADVKTRGLDAVMAEALPVEAVMRIADGEHRLRVWREHRGFTVRALASAASVSPSYITEMETGKKPGSVRATGRLAKALGIRLDVLLGSED